MRWKAPSFLTFHRVENLRSPNQTPNFVCKNPVPYILLLFQHVTFLKSGLKNLSVNSIVTEKNPQIFYRSVILGLQKKCSFMDARIRQFEVFWL